MRSSVLCGVATSARLLEVVLLHLLSCLDKVKCFVECFVVLHYASFFINDVLLLVCFLVTFLFVRHHVSADDFDFHLRLLLRVVGNF